MEKGIPWQVETITTEKKQAAPPPPRRDQDVRHFLDEQGGIIVILSEDALFIKTVRTSMLRALQIKNNCVESFHDPGAALSAIRDRARARIPVLTLADRLLAGKPNMDFLRTVKHLYPALKLIVMTYETTKETLALLLEIGVDHVVTKPASVDMLIDKLAGVIKPQSKIAQLVQEARTHLEQKDCDAAFKICDSISSLKETNSSAMLLRGEAYLKSGNTEAALKEFEKAHEASPQFLEPLKRLADLNRERDETRFLNYMLQLDSISPLNVERKCEIGKTFLHRNETGNAKEYFDKAIECAHEEAKRYLCAIISDAAQAILETAPELSGQYYAQYFAVKGDELSREDMIAFNNYGIALRKQGKWQEALENYRLALKVDPEDSRILYNCGLAYADGEQHRKAIELYEKVLGKDPDFHRKAASVSYNIANSYCHLKDFETAKKYLQVALELDPEHAPAKKLMTVVSQPPLG